MLDYEKGPRVSRRLIPGRHIALVEVYQFVSLSMNQVDIYIIYVNRTRENCGNCSCTLLQFLFHFIHNGLFELVDLLF